MQIPIYHIDAFTNAIFSGNPGAVCVLPEWIHDDQLHAIAKENNLPVTAFLVRKVEHYEIRWITPEYELDLCGHGSLCAGYVIFNILEPSIQQAKLKSRIEMLAVGLGLDIAEIDRIEAALTRHGAPILERLYAPAEVAYCESYRGKFERYAGRFAAKEAAMKALGTGWRSGVRWRDIGDAGSDGQTLAAVARSRG